MYTKFAIGSIRLRSERKRAGFSLVEVTLALGLVAFCVVAMLGVLPMGLKQERESTDQLVATQVLAAVESDFQNISTNAGQTMRYVIPTNGGSQGSFFIDNSLGRTEQEADAEYNVWYQVTGTAGSQVDPRMHLFITRARPSTLAQQAVIAEGIVQKRSSANAN